VLSFTCETGRVDVHEAWTTAEILSTLERIFADWEHKLPADRDARVVVKPNLNNDLVALTGNCVDLRVLRGIVDALQRRGYRDITLADGSNVGVERRGISTFRRLRVQGLADLLGVRTVDLNHDEGTVVVLHESARPRVARTVFEADFLVSVPKVKTHAEAGLSCAMKNWVGIACGQDKRHVHYDLGRNIFALNEVVVPDLVVVDGLVGMEGNGPGDGEPFRFGRLAVADNAFVNDLVMCRLVGLPPAEVPYLVHAFEAGHLTAELAARVEHELPVLRPIKRAPARSRLAELSEARSLLWLKQAVRPIVSQPRVAELAYKAKIIQDVYSLDDDTLRLVGRDSNKCGSCRRCVDFCPTGLALDDIGVKTGAPDCVQCLYCWWVCPEGALQLGGEAHAMQRQIDRYKPQIERF
jgi:uncharacterized protein (DUF362 family)/ferredoxin